MKKDVWEPCPRCESKSVKVMSKAFFFIIGLVSSGCFVWFLLLIPPIGIIGVLIGLVLMIGSPFMKPMLQCNDCKKTWTYKKKKELES